MDVHAGAHIPGLLWGAYTFFSDTGYQSVFQHLNNADTVFTDIMSVIRDRINSFLWDRRQALDKGKNGAIESRNLNVLFYTAALFIRRLHISGVPDNSRLKPHIYRSIDNCLPTLAKYKQKVLDVDGADALLEQRYRGSDRGVARFSPEWWKFLYEPCLVEAMEDGTGYTFEK